MQGKLLRPSDAYIRQCTLSPSVQLRHQTTANIQSGLLVTETQILRCSFEKTHLNISSTKYQPPLSYNHSWINLWFTPGHMWPPRHIWWWPNVFFKPDHMQQRCGVCWWFGVYFTPGYTQLECNFYWMTRYPIHAEEHATMGCLLITLCQFHTRKFANVILTNPVAMWRHYVGTVLITTNLPMSPWLLPSLSRTPHAVGLHLNRGFLPSRAGASRGSVERSVNRGFSMSCKPFPVCVLRFQAIGPRYASRKSCVHAFMPVSTCIIRTPLVFLGTYNFTMWLQLCFPELWDNSRHPCQHSSNGPELGWLWWT